MVTKELKAILKYSRKVDVNIDYRRKSYFSYVVYFTENEEFEDMLEAKKKVDSLAFKELVI